MKKLETLFNSFAMALLLCTTIQLSANSAGYLNVSHYEPIIAHSSIVCDNATEGGEIVGDEIGCANPTFDPSLITSLSPASGGTGDLEYLWIYTTDNPTGQFTDWIAIPNSNSETLDPEAITQTTWYRRCARRSECVDYEAESNYVIKEIYCCDNVIDGGEITANQQGCGSDFTPNPILNSVSPSGGSGTFEYVWYSSTNSSIYTDGSPDWTIIAGIDGDSFMPSAISETTYYIRLSRRNGCNEYVGESNVITVTINPLPTLNAEILTNINCFGDASGAVDLTISGGAMPYEALWNGSMTNEEDPTDLGAGTHTVIVTDSNSCFASLEVELNTPSEINIDATANAPTCFDANGSIDVILSGGTGDLNITWEDGQYNGQTTLTDLTSGIYNTTVTDMNGCQVTQSITVENGADGLSVTLDATNPTCFDTTNGTITANVTGGTMPYSYVWNDDNSLNEATIDNLTIGMYTVAIMDANGCTFTESITLTAADAMVLSFETTSADCGGAENGSATVFTENGQAPWSYLWDDANNTDSPVLENVGIGNYEVTVTDALGCITTAVAIVTNPPSMNVSFTVQNATCQGMSDGTATVNVMGGVAPYTYLWDDDNAQTTITATGLDPGIYEVTIIDAAGCTAIESIQVLDASSFIIEASVLQNASCNGINDGTATVNILNGATSFTYLWNDANAQTTATASNLAIGDYEVLVTDLNGCMATTSVDIQASTTITYETSTEPETCQNAADGSATIMQVFGGIAPYSYTWNDANAQSSATLTGLSAGIYAFTITDANGCQNDGQTTIDAGTGLTMQSFSTNLSCANENEGEAMVIVTNGSAPYTYLWNDALAQTNSLATNLAAGDYTVTVTDSNGCIGLSTIEVTSPDAMVLNLDSLSPFCENDSSGNIWVNVVGGIAPYSYSWSNGASTPEIFNLSVGNYSVTVTDANNCTISESISISATTTLSASIATTNPNCANGNDGSAQLLATGGIMPYTASWSNGATGLMINSLSAGTYSATLTDGDGCSQVLNFQLQNPDAIICDAFVSMQISETGGSNGAISVTSEGGTGTYNYSWNNGADTQTVSDLSPGIYGVTVTDTNDCNCITSVQLFDPGKIGNFVWWDLNENGLQDIDETGIENVTVNLAGTSSFGQAINANTTTDALGMYEFNALPVGTYTVTFEAPSMYEFTEGDVGNNEAIDSDADPITGEATTIYLPEGQYNQDIDAGLTIATVDIGNYVWFDTNRNGLQDGFENGVDNYLVQLYDANDNTMQGNTFTNAQGLYLFENVLPGNYYIQFSTVSLPNGFVFSPQNEGNDDTIDSDASVNGQTVVFTITLNQADDNTFDAGIYELCDNVLSGGNIQGDEALCGIGSNPNEITNTVLPTGGLGGLEYLWLMSNTPIYNGPGDPNWTIIPNSNNLNYDPAPIFQTTYYIRCARRDGCTEFIGETNIVEKTINPYPLTNIQTMSSSPCPGDLNTFEATTAGAGATYAWTFEGASPATASTRVVNNIIWSSDGAYEVTLTVTHNGCTLTTTMTVNVDDCFGGGSVSNLVANPMNNEAVELRWQSYNNHDNQVFYIESSVDGIHFQEVAMLTAIAAEGLQTYESMDYQPRAGANFYRVRMLDIISGSMITSELVQADIKSINHALVSVYPNPLVNKINVRLLTATTEIVTIELIDAFGQLHQTLLIPANQLTTEINMTHLPDGIYFLQINQPNRRMQVQKLIKQQ